MLNRLYQRVPLLNRLPPWAAALGLASILILAGMGQGLVQGQTTATVEQTLTVATALSTTFKLDVPTPEQGSTVLAGNTLIGATTIIVSSTDKFTIGDFVRVGTDPIKQEIRTVSRIVANNEMRLDSPLAVEHGAGEQVKELQLLEEVALGGIVTEGKTRFLTQLTFRQGEKGRIKLALENNGNQPAVGRLEVAIPAASAITLTVESLDLSKVNQPVKSSPNTYLVAIQPNTKGTAVNLAVDLQSADTTPPGTYPLDIRLQQVPN